MKIGAPFKLKPILLGLACGFFLMLVLAEWFQVAQPSKYGEWTLRRLKETTALEMHAEDIWRNRRSTLKTFDPLACKTEHHHSWKNTWYEVTCSAEDEAGQVWAYIVRYGIRSSSFISWLPFLKEERPAKELLRTNDKPMKSGMAQ